MIKEFTDRRPALSALLVVALFTVVPGGVMCLAAALSGGRENAAGFVLVYTLLLQTLLWLKVERPILNLIPFVMSLLGLIVSEIVYTVSLSMTPVGVGPDAMAMLFSAGLVTLFGAEAAGSVGGMILYVGLAVLKKLWELIFRP